jgi:hypothetical protein
MFESEIFAEQGEEIVLRLECVVLKETEQFGFKLLIPRVSHGLVSSRRFPFVRKPAVSKSGNLVKFGVFMN